MISTSVRRWPLKRPFEISRHVFEDNLVLEVMVEADGFVGRGECEPHEHDEATAQAAASAVRRLAREAWSHLDPVRMNAFVARSAWRNALDCALWDLRTKREGRRIWEILELPIRAEDSWPILETLSLDSPVKMAAAAIEASGAAGLKLKLGAGDGLDAERLEAVRAAAPHAILIVDANEGWSPQQLARMLPLAAALDVALIEQPVPHSCEAALADMPRLVPLCADESCLDRASLPALTGLYDAINIKLDKTGGLTEAIALADEASRHGLKVMVGCNGGTSLGQAPAVMLAHTAFLVDLGGDWLAEDHSPRLDDSDFRIRPPSRELWG